MRGESICPCESFEHPRTLVNQPGLTHVRYRSGDFRTFRRALLQPMEGEGDLISWRPNAHGDLLLQVFEWWAYVADVLTFYNERSLNENLLATASLDESIRRLVKVLGYRPRPGIGGSADLSVLLGGPRPLTVPPGFRVESKPAPGKAPQTFESTEAITLSMPDAVHAEPPGTLAGPAKQLYLEGAVSSIQPGDHLLLAPAGTQQNATLIIVQHVVKGKDAAGQPYTEIIPEGSPALPAADASGHRLLQSRRTSGLWKYQTSIPLVSSPLDLEGIDRAIGAGEAIVLTAPVTGLAPHVLDVTGTHEEIWYTNGHGPTPPAPPTIPAGAPHTRVDWTSSDHFRITPWNHLSSKVRLLLDWQPAGTLRNAPIATYSGNPMTLVAASGKRFQTGETRPVLIEDAEGNGVLARAYALDSAPEQLQIASFDVTPVPVLKTPLRVLQDVIHLTRGKTVDQEVLGLGNAAVAGQEFVLQKSPLTYFPAGDSYQSTLRVRVNGVEWTEVPSFYGQDPDAQVFVTYEDDNQKTHVLFGDWVNGSGLPTGALVLADYRIGSGADDLDPGSLTVISRPIPGLRSVRQPTLAGGGADPIPRDQVRRYAPKSVMTFGRAISADDYEAIAAGAPGVTRAKSVFAWNALEQRASATIYVGDTSAAVENARNALLAAADPNRPFSVLAATAVKVAVFMTIRVMPGRVSADIVSAVRNALADPDAGLIGERHTRIGEGIYLSQVLEACQDIPGVQSVTGIGLLLSRPDPVTGELGGALPRINAAPNEYFTLPLKWAWIAAED